MNTTIVVAMNIDGYNDEYSFRFNMEENEVHNTYRNINEDIFGEVDEEYVNESTK